MSSDKCGHPRHVFALRPRPIKPRLDSVAELHEKPTLTLNIKGVGPLKALQLLANKIQNVPSKMAQWRDEAAVAAIMGSCPRSKDSFRSGEQMLSCSCAVWCALCVSAGIGHWIRFVEVIHGVKSAESRAFPPQLRDVLAWSNTFQCLGTFGNYLSHLRGACHAIGCEAPPTGHPALRRAMIAITKRELFTAREKLFIDRFQFLGLCARAVCHRTKFGRTIVCNLVASAQKKGEGMFYAALWLITYLFLLRLPSEVMRVIWLKVGPNSVVS